MNCKKILCVVLAIVFIGTSSKIVFAKDWGLGFPVEGQKAVGNETSDYLKKFDAYYVSETSEKVIYLTFDAGYENGHTAGILDTLKKNDVKATFFLVGHYFEANPEMIKRIVDEGHIIGNHTMNHPDMTKITDKAKFTEELTKIEDLYRDITGQEIPKLYRPPQGKYSEENLKLTQELGYKTFLWSLSYADFDNKKQPTKEHAFSKLIPRVHPGAVILLHNTSKTSAEILDELIQKYRDLGYEFKNLDEF
ncbi:MAG: polysaccharide deacetylase family protein [Defluviitaleaceae bacterium]|nr:polysaccharide deacetylase family protein [Defluviitaleaceae bacterium]